MKANQELERLIVSYLDGSAGKKEAAELATLLAGDPEAAAQFATACRTDFALAGHFENEASALETRRELAQAITEAEKREARAEVFRARGAAVAARYRRTIKPVLRAAAVLAILAVAAYAFWPDRSTAVVADTGDGSVVTSKTNRVPLPEGQPVRGLGKLAMRDDVKRKLNEFHLPSVEIEDSGLAGAVDTILQQYNEIASTHGVPAIDISNIQLASGVDAAIPVRLNLDTSIPVSTALTAVALQAGARVRYTADGAVIEPFPIPDPEEIVTRHLHLSELAFRWMSEGASTTWAETEEGMRWDAGNVLQTYGIPLESGRDRAWYVASDQKLEITTTRENASRIDALRLSAEAAGKNQIVLTTRTVELPLAIESAELEAQLPTLVQTESLITDPEFQIMMRAVQQIEGASTVSMPMVTSVAGGDVEITGNSHGMGHWSFDNAASPMPSPRSILTEMSSSRISSVSNLEKG